MPIDLDRFPRVRFAHLPTPLEPLEGLSAELGGPPIWIKRDDCTGLATGGNKARKLEFLVGEALEQGADTLITFGALQSNHARQTAAAAARCGLACELILVRLVAHDEPAYTRSGNLLLDDLLGARVHAVDDDAGAVQVLREILSSLEGAGRHAYVIPPGGSNAVGSLGSVDCAAEIAGQAQAHGLDFGALLHATASTGTQAGLVVGFHALGETTPVLGINVYSRDPAAIEASLATVCDETAAKLGVTAPPEAQRRICHEFLGAGYGVPTDAMKQALRLVARCEGVLLDPVYTGKAMAGLIALVRRGELPADRPVLFLHTGGTASLPAYREALG